MSSVATRFKARPQSVPAARRLVGDGLRGVPATIREAAVLVTSELVTNALLHAGRSFAVVLAVSPDTVRVEVHDGSARPPRFRAPTASDTGGRGLHVVEALTSRWGTERTWDGKAVWFEIDR